MVRSRIPRTETEGATGTEAAFSSAPARSPLVSLVALRLVLIAATSYLLLVQGDGFVLPFTSAALLVAALASNVAFFWLPRAWTAAPAFLAVLIVVDLAWITGVLLLSGHFRSEFFYIYFLVLFVAGIGDNLRLIVLGATAIGIAYLLSVVSTSGAQTLLSSQTLIRIPFLLAVATFYGFLVDRSRRHRRVADEEHRALVHQAEVNTALEREIGERRRAQSEAVKLSRAVEQSPSMVLITDPHTRVEYVNPRYCSVMGCSPEDVLGRTLHELDLVSSGGGDGADEGEAGESGWRREAVLERRDGEELWATISVSPIQDETGAVIHLVAVLEDMTHVKAAEDALRKANEDLKKLSQMKSDFISTVSHELRTPLTAMKNALDILGSLEPGPQEEAHERFLGVAMRNVERLTGLVNDILDLSRIEAGRLDYRFGELALTPLLQNVAESLEGQAEAQSIELAVEAPADLPPVWADGRRLEQVLVNLVGNALKFTPRGGRVKIHAEAGEDDVDVAVVDTGVGLSADDRRRVFQPFYQVDDALTRATKGSGLGLAISRQMVEAHGGELSVESEIGAGSRFHFRVPYASPRAEEMTALEERFGEYRSYPFFSVLLVAVADAGTLEAVGAELKSALPRSADRILRQVAHRRFVLVLLGTDRQGAAVVRRRLAERFERGPLAGGPTAPRVLGPAAFPEDGSTSYQILRAILEPDGEAAPSRQEPGAPSVAAATANHP